MKKIKRRKSLFINTILILLIFLIFLSPARGEDTIKEEQSDDGENALIYGEFYLLQTVSTGDDNFNTQDSIGFEAYKKFSGEYGDWGEGDLQFRMTYSPLKNMIVTPMHADFDSIGQPVIYNAFLNFKGNMGRSNIKIGHFDVPFGLEPDLDTHATLLQTLAMSNFGYIQDWGISLNGQLENIDYEAGIFTGTGDNLLFDRSAYLFSGRITNPVENDLRWGISAAGGKNLRGGNLESLWRLGFDTQYVYAQWTFKGEVYGGQTEGHPAYGVLGEIDYMFPGQNLELELQFQRSSNSTDLPDSDTTALIAGLTYRLSESWYLRTAYSHYFNLPGAMSSDQVGIQFYFYGKNNEKQRDKQNNWNTEERRKKEDLTLK
ncbi:MAG: hypothetical protein BWY64_02869 [bacterium ADurb.Bin363]|nr:MAG: hypothetical protein BWY64_02869 [bacterium ADurb.Bin363]